MSDTNILPNDQNFVRAAGFESSSTAGLVMAGQIDEITGRILVDNAGSSSITVANEATDTTCFPIFVTAATGSLEAKSNAGLTFNSNTARLNSTTLASSSLTASELLASDGSKNLVSLAVATYPSLTEISYVKGVTSAIQTQINAKAPSTSPTFATSITGSYLTASEILITDGSKNIVSAAVATYPSLTELTYVKGVTSAIQTQLNAKQGSITGSDTQVLFFDGANTPAGDAGFTFNKTTNIATLGGLVTADIHTVDANSATTILIKAGAAISGNTAGGNASLRGGNGFGSAQGGYTNLTSGNGGATGNGGEVDIFSGNGGATSGNGGYIGLWGGVGLAGNGNGGDIFINAGAPHGSGTKGKLFIKDGAGSQYAILDTASIASSNKTFTFPNYTGTLQAWVSVPASAAASGVAGSMAYESGFLYVCVATNTWQRVAIAAW